MAGSASGDELASAEDRQQETMANSEARPESHSNSPILESVRIGARPSSWFNTIFKPGCKDKLRLGN